MKKLNMARIIMAAACALGLVIPVAVLAAGPAPINLGTAGNFAILAKTGVSATGSTVVVGDIGLSPAAATYITGFGLILPAASSFSTSALVSGKIYAPGYADPTPANLTTAVLDMQNAYTDGVGRASTATELGAGNIGGLTIAPGVYKWGTGVTVPTSVTLSGGSNDVWIFVIAQNLTVSSGVQVILSGGGQASNVFWVVAGQTTIGTGAVFNGNILDQTSIVLNTGAKLNGRALAQAAVTLDSNSVATPGTGYVTTMSSPVYSAPVYSNPVNATVNYAAIPSNIPSNIQYQGGQAMPVLDAMGNQVMPASAPSQAPAYSGQQIRTIAADLAQGSRDSNVATLQQFLISQNKGQSAQTLANIGATSYFGAMTRAALAEFQAYVGISPALGNFGPVTRAYIGAHY